VSRRLPDGNLFLVVEPAQPEEVVEPLVEGGGVLVERIVSSGQATPTGEWLEQSRDEWVVLLRGRAELSFADGSRLELTVGDYVLVPSGVRHRVDGTSSSPPCIWLAVHALALAVPRAAGAV
jgi:cupin 2 domain-containing protein